MVADVALSVVSFNLKCALPLAFAAVAFSDKDRRLLAKRAAMNAAMHGVPMPKWQRWRKGREVRCDLLMVFAPEQESDRLLKAGRNHTRKEKAE